MGTPLTENASNQLLRTCRTTVGDELRSITYFTRTEHQHLYLRDDLERGPDPKSFVTNERGGFSSQRTYEWSELGRYRYTMRAFENGYLVRVIKGDQGAYITTDSMTIDRFNDVAEAVSGVFEELSADGQ